MTFRDLVEGNINKNNWSKLKDFMKKQPGFASWTFEGDYDTLVIKFKSNKQAINAQKKSNDSYTEISAFGDSSAGDSEIRVEISKEAKSAMNEGFNLSHVQKDFDQVIAWFEKVTDVSYTGDGDVTVKGKSKIRKDKDYVIYKGNAQLGSNLAKGIADHFKLKEPKMIEV